MSLECSGDSWPVLITHLLNTAHGWHQAPRHPQILPGIPGLRLDVITCCEFQRFHVHARLSTLPETRGYSICPSSPCTHQIGLYRGLALGFKHCSWSSLLGFREKIFNEFGVGIRTGFPTISKAALSTHLTFCTAELCKMAFSASAILKPKYWAGL